MEGAVLPSKSAQPNKSTSGYSFQVHRPQTMTQACMHTYCGSPQTSEAATQDTLCSHSTNLTSREYSHGTVGHACFVRDYTIAIVCTYYTPCPSDLIPGTLEETWRSRGGASPREKLSVRRQQNRRRDQKTRACQRPHDASTSLRCFMQG